MSPEEKLLQNIKNLPLREPSAKLDQEIEKLATFASTLPEEKSSPLRVLAFICVFLLFGALCFGAGWHFRGQVEPKVPPSKTPPPPPIPEPSTQQKVILTQQRSLFDFSRQRDPLLPSSLKVQYFNGEPK